MTNRRSDVDHRAEALRLARRAESWRDFDRWEMTDAHRDGLAAADAALAQVHATLHLADITKTATERFEVINL